MHHAWTRIPATDGISFSWIVVRKPSCKEPLAERHGFSYNFATFEYLSNISHFTFQMP